MGLKAGEQLEVLLDYAPSLETIPRWAERAGHRVLRMEQRARGEWCILLEK